jgi:hypothetical protein
VKKLFIHISLFAFVLALGFVSAPLFAHPQTQGEGQASFGCKKDQGLCVVEKFAPVVSGIMDAPAPLFTKPTPPPPTKPKDITRTVKYRVISKGNLSASISEFKAQANQTLNSPNGWAQLGIAFKEVSSGGEFILVLSEASQVPTFSSGCDSQYSCRVGDYVIINENRWVSATSSWNNAGGGLRDYRHMVINHEVGHWLGHGHYSCGGAGQSAPVMQQQSIDLQGCKFNAWPLDKEMFSSRYGI